MTNSDAAINIVISGRGVEGLNICGPLRGHPAALRLAGAVLPAVALLDAMIRDFCEDNSPPSLTADGMRPAMVGAQEKSPPAGRR